MLYPHVGVYYDSDSVRYHLSQFKQFNPLMDCASYNNYEELFRSRAKVKIAGLHVPYPFEQDFSEKVNSLCDICDRVFIIATEVHPEIVNFICKHDKPNITYYLSGCLNFPLHFAQIKYYMDWFETSTYFYRHWLPEILTRFRPFDVKYRAFDILLGRKKLHRDELFQHARNNPGIGIISYFNSHDTILNNDPEKWIWEHTGVEKINELNWTVDTVKYYGHPTSLSQVIPINVYNQTAYSVIAETCFQDNFSFFTEKTSKPMIAKRLFVMFAGRFYLKNLKKLGFKTFDSIIDESYDEEIDALIRWKLAWEQMVWLANQSQEEILAKIRPIVEHNFNHIMTTNWASDFRLELEKDFVRAIAD